MFSCLRVLSVYERKQVFALPRISLYIARVYLTQSYSQSSWFSGVSFGSRDSDSSSCPYRRFQICLINTSKYYNNRRTPRQRRSIFFLRVVAIEALLLSKKLIRGKGSAVRPMQTIEVAHLVYFFVSERRGSLTKNRRTYDTFFVFCFA